MLKEFQNKTVLVTGHTGFKGAWLSAWLKSLGANLVGISLDVPTNPSHFEYLNIKNSIDDLRIDIKNYAALEDAILSAQPDYVFHLAAQALVRNSYSDPMGTWHTNVLGTLNVLEALRKLEKPCAAVIITSDKCYDNVEWVWGYRENDPMGGPDPYSASKGAAELAIKSQIKSFFNSDKSNVRIASARAGNVIGGGDWAADRIVPDCVRAWSEGRVVNLRNPHSTRPWQHVLEPLSGYLNLAVALKRDQLYHGESFNFGPQSQQTKSVTELVQEMSLSWDKVCWNHPQDSSTLKNPYESSLLKLNCDKALHYLGWHALMSFENTVKMTADWYKVFYENPNKISATTLSQIDSYVALANSRGMLWAQ